MTKKAIEVYAPFVRVTMGPMGPEVLEYSLETAKQQNTGWEIFSRGLALVLTNKEAGLTVGAMLGSTKRGSSAVAAVSTVDRTDVGYALLELDYGGGFTPEKLQEWLNSAAINLLDSYGVLKEMPEDAAEEDSEVEEGAPDEDAGAKDETHMADEGTGAEDTQQEDGSKAGEETG